MNGDSQLRDGPENAVNYSCFVRNCNFAGTMQCSGDSRGFGQSPVDIDESKVVRVEYPPLIMSGHWSKDGEAVLKNTGNTVQIKLEGKRNPATIYGGPLAGNVYEFSELTFRWGPSDCLGAEHTLNGTWFTMEAQAMHFNRRYATVENCRDKPDGFVACSYFLQVYQLPAWDEHPLFSLVTDNLHRITQPETSVRIPSYSLSWMKQACQTPGYFTYSGSMTTPPYEECVTWIIFPEPVRISETQAHLFRMLRNKRGGYIRENFRDVQKLNNRLIYYVC